MYKYNKNAENLNSYKIPSTKNFKYKLDMGEWNFPIHETVINEASNITNNELSLYNVYDEQFEELIKLIKLYNHLDIENPDYNVIVTNGSDNSLRLILDLFATDKSKFLIPVPSYYHFECMLNTFKIKHLEKLYIDYKLDNNNIFILINNELSNNYDLCYLVNPNMPIGYTLSNENIELLLINNPNTIFVIDEAYIEFSECHSSAPLIKKYNNLIIVKTFSKFFSLASLRIGYLISNNKIIKLLDPYYNQKDVTKIAINCAYKSLQNISHYDKNKSEFLEIRSYIKNRLDKIIMNNSKIFEYILRDGMYFTLLTHNPRQLHEYFEKNNIATRNKNDDIPGAIRITISRKEIMDEVFTILEKYT